VKKSISDCKWKHRKIIWYYQIFFFRNPIFTNEKVIYILVQNRKIMYIHKLQNALRNLYQYLFGLVLCIPVEPYSQHFYSAESCTPTQALLPMAGNAAGLRYEKTVAEAPTVICGARIRLPRARIPLYHARLPCPALPRTPHDFLASTPADT